jgi:hypothetical protein
MAGPAVRMGAALLGACDCFDVNDTAGLKLLALIVTAPWHCDSITT